MAKHIYTEEDDKIIAEAIKSSPTNLVAAFKVAAKKIGVSKDAIGCHYYHSIQKENNKLFLTISSKRNATNYKVTRKGKKATKYQPENTKKSKWKRILAILAE